jgi:hypothetical protein
MPFTTVVEAVTGKSPVWKNHRSVSVATFVLLICAQARLCEKLWPGSWPYIGQLHPSAFAAAGARPNTSSDDTSRPISAGTRCAVRGSPIALPVAICVPRCRYEARV